MENNQDIQCRVDRQEVLLNGFPGVGGWVWVCVREASEVAKLV